MAAVQGWVASIMFGLGIGYISVGMDSFEADFEKEGSPFLIDKDDVATFGELRRFPSDKLSHQLRPRYVSMVPSMLILPNSKQIWYHIHEFISHWPHMLRLFHPKKHTTNN